jgi:hypothetical protein
MAFTDNIELLLWDVVGAPAVPVLEDSKSKRSRALAVFGTFAVAVPLQISCGGLAHGVSGLVPDLLAEEPAVF